MRVSLLLSEHVLIRNLKILKLSGLQTGSKFTLCKLQMRVIVGFGNRIKQSSLPVGGQSY